MCCTLQVLLDVISLPPRFCHSFQACLLVLWKQSHNLSPWLQYLFLFHYWQNYFSEHRLDHVNVLKVLKFGVFQSSTLSMTIEVLHILFLVCLSSSIYYCSRPLSRSLATCSVWLHPSVLKHDAHLHPSLTLQMLLLLPEWLFLLPLFPHDHPSGSNLN